MKTSKVAVIGAGVSGLSCARNLTDRGWQVTVFEKSRGVGGRMAVRRTDSELAFDHGAQYFTVRDGRFAETVAQWQRQGCAARWEGRIAVIQNGIVRLDLDDTPRFVGVPGMNAVCKQLADGVEVRCQSRVSPPRREEAAWILRDEAGRLLGQFEYVVISTPSPQAADLLAHVPRLAAQTRLVAMQPCWTVILAVENRIAAEFDGAFVHESPLSWISRNSSKPQRSRDLDSWVLQGSAEWSSAHLDADPNIAQRDLLSAFWRSLGQSPQVSRFDAVHRWKYARASEPLSDRFWFDATLGVGVCGDWCCGSRVEGAFLSGWALAERMLAT